jgi:hypothetical protein
MKKTLIGSALSTLALSLVSIAAFAAETAVTEKLLSRLLNQNLHGNLFEARNLPWQAGSYGLTINRAGDANISSANGAIKITVPLQTSIVGNIDQDLGFTKVALDCSSQFNNIGELLVTPSFTAQEVKFAVDLKLPIPPVNADCGGISFPITTFLQQLVANNKSQWEQDIRQGLLEQFNPPQKPGAAR